VEYAADEPSPAEMGKLEAAVKVAANLCVSKCSRLYSRSHACRSYAAHVTLPVPPRAPALSRSLPSSHTPPHTNTKTRAPQRPLTHPAPTPQ
jgi:hypothetical protein